MNEIEFLLFLLSVIEQGDPSGILGPVSNLCLNSTFALYQFSVFQRGDDFFAKFDFLDPTDPSTKTHHRISATLESTGFEQVLVQ